MKFTNSKDIAAPLEFVFAELTDFAALQRLATRRRTRVARLDTLAESGPGMRWRLEFRLRGRDREVEVRLADLVAHERIGYVFESDTIDGRLRIELVEPAPGVTRMTNVITVKGRKLGMLLLLQSARVTYGHSSRRIEDGLTTLATRIEGRWRDSRP